ncbi:hypothetical protein ACEWF9_08460, partial [Bifidobacterium longum subsp. longum]|uniref:hypothetical protein n=2 Tax=Bifidobacterium longum TaxID=216816 RepID=UPI003D047B80
FVSVASGHLTLLAVGQVLQRSLEPAPPLFFFGGGYCSPGKYVYVHAVAMYILLSVDNVLIQMNWREMAICLIQLI